jgi:HK97 family phage major capsid protein
MSRQEIAQLTTKSVIAEGEKWVRVIASAATLDRDGEVLDTNSIRVPVKPMGWKYASDLTESDLVDLPFLIDHNWSVEKQLGSVKKMFINNDGELEALVGFTSLSRGKEAHQLAKEGHLGNSFSGTFDYSEAFTAEGKIYDSEIVELSMVFKGSNRNARILEVSKSLKGKKMDEDNKPVPTPSEEVSQKDIASLVEKAVTEKLEAKALADKELAEKKAKEEMTEKSIAAKQATPAPAVVQPDSPKAKKMTKAEQRVMFVDQVKAYIKGDKQKLAELNEKAYKADSGSEHAELQKKAIDFSDGTSIYQSEVVATDVREQYALISSLSDLVTRIDITGAETWKQIIQAAGNGFQPVGAEEEKQEDKPVWTHLSIEPKEHALIVAWYDGMAKRTPLAVYQTIVQYIAKEYRKLEEKIILSFSGTTTGGGDVFAATGIIPILLTDGTRVVNAADFTAANVQAAIGRAYGLVESDDELTLVTSRKTWGMLATVVQTTGAPLFTQVGQQMTAGALGSFNVRLSNRVTDGNVVVGAFKDYELVTNGGLETLFSREATVGDLNLFTSDASALRANVDIAGKPVFNKSFAMIDFVTAVS